MNATEKNIGNINIESVNKKKFTINNDENKVIELAVGDVGIVTRAKDCTKEIEEIQSDAEKLQNFKADVNDEEYNKQVEMLKKLDVKMRKIINNIFDYDVCTPIMENKSAFTVINGVMLYEIVIDNLLDFIDKEATKEVKKLRKRIKGHTDKYIKG